MISLVLVLLSLVLHVAHRGVWGSALQEVFGEIDKEDMLHKMSNQRGLPSSGVQNNVQKGFVIVHF